MTENILLLSILIPFLAGVLSFVLPNRLRSIFTLSVSSVNFLFALYLFKKEANLILPWAGFGIDFSLRLYHFSAFILLAASFFGLLISIYVISFLKGKHIWRHFYAYLLLTLSLVNGALLSDNLIVLLFFWEGLLLTLYAMIYIGSRNAFRAATKALVISGFCDLCMMAGIIITGHLAGNFSIRSINLTLNWPGGLAFALLTIGAIAKAGAMPFHTWIPDAAEEAPLPFMAFLPASLEKLLGIYFLSRITLDMFKLTPGSAYSFALMSIGALTIILAVMMALVQNNYKRLLSYHAISQVGYMILGIGTCLPIGIIGGIFHMFNHALYKCGLFLTGGAVERQAGSTELGNLGGLGINMPITCACFIVLASSISGVWPFNGFFSKELIYDAALERGRVFYLAALAGSFFTAVSFLKLGHAAFFGKAASKVREAPVSMLAPMIILAFACTYFGVFNRFPLNNFIIPVLGADLKPHNFSAFPANNILVILTAVVILSAFTHHFIAVRISRKAAAATDHIHYAPVLSKLYDWAQKKYFDPYEMGMRLINKIARIFWAIDRAIDWIVEKLTTRIIFSVSRSIHKTQAGYYVVYVIWAFMGAFLVIFFTLR